MASVIPLRGSSSEAADRRTTRSSGAMPQRARAASLLCGWKHSRSQPLGITVAADGKTSDSAARAAIQCEGVISETGDGRRSLRFNISAVCEKSQW